ncbi:MAG: galactokinase family protein, partial [Firmicutes bacterium]|nr:galactokinase family protein [Bacillota bacterium]
MEDISIRFKETFFKGPERLFSAPGRIEIGGNHTDHQN